MRKSAVIGATLFGACSCRHPLLGVLERAGAHLLRRQRRPRSDGGGLMNTLVGITEIAKRLRLSRHRAHVLAIA